MSCVNRAFLLTGKILTRWGGRIETSLCPLECPVGGGASGGSLRSSRQAVACHPFTRSWATMPPETPPPPGFSEEFVFVIHMLYICDIIYNEKDYEYSSS